MSSPTDDESLHALPPQVAERITDELSGRGEKVLGCMRTAAALISQAAADEEGLRLAQSAGYNLREALDAVVTAQSPAENLLQTVLDAWERYRADMRAPELDPNQSLETFEDVVKRVAERRQQNSRRDAQLLAYLTARAGVPPVPGDLDPGSEYARLLSAANALVHEQKLHGPSALEEATALYAGTRAWLVRIFTPSDVTVRALSELAREPWTGQEQINRLNSLVSSVHHLRLFFSALVDPAWLDALYEAGVIRPPQPGALWPAAALENGPGRTSPAELAHLLERLLADVKTLPAKERAEARFMLLRTASQLGPAGYPIITQVIAAEPTHHAVQALAVACVKQADPTDSLVVKVADAVLSGNPHDRDRYYASTVLDRLEAGLDVSNVRSRVGLLAAKVRRMAGHKGMTAVILGSARLTADLDDEYGHAVRMAHYLARMLARAHALEVEYIQLRAWTDKVPGELGERLTCRVLAQATDAPPEEKIRHIARRLASPVATGDDLDLVENILTDAPDTAVLAEAWGAALGAPSATPPDGVASAFSSDWARAWRWSAVLPDCVLMPWQTAIASVTALRGSPDRTLLERRSRPSHVLAGRSAYSEEELAALPVLEAAALVARWRPDEASERTLTGARELARTLEGVVQLSPGPWSADSTAVVKALREPVHVLHYFRALTTKARDIVPHTSAVLDAAALVRAARWEPAVLGQDDYDFEPDWTNVDTAIVALCEALADSDADLAEHLDTIWAWALSLIDSPSDDALSSSSADDLDTLHRAINNARGAGMESVIALARWEYRHTHTVRADLCQVLDEALQVPGQAGGEYRAILALHRLSLETVASAWLDENAAMLFSQGEEGHETFELTLKYSRPTPWFYRHLRHELYAAVRRGAERAASWLMIAALNNEDGYDLKDILAGLRGDRDALATAVSALASLAHTTDAEAPQLAVAVRLWQQLLDADRHDVPAEALTGCGQWALASGISDTDWSRLMLCTLEITGGATDLSMEVADRCSTAGASAANAQILLLLLGHGEPWERYSIAHTAMKALRVMAQGPAYEDFRRLRTRLIDLGHHDAAQIHTQDRQEP